MLTRKSIHGIMSHTFEKLWKYIMKTNKINYQYAYTCETEFAYSEKQKPGWLKVKNGQTLIDTKGRVKDQDISSTTSTLIIVSEISVDNNSDVKLDDKIRNVIHEYPNFEAYTRKDRKRGEWTWVRIEDIVESLDLPYEDSLLENKDFLAALETRLNDAKNKAINSLLGKKARRVISLRLPQRTILSKMLSSDKYYNLLSLCPRFGKTYLMLEYAQELTKKYDNLVLVISSKSKGSDASFISSYKNVGYDFEIVEATLYQGDDSVLTNLSSKIQSHHNVILVTDEADMGAHTENSRAKHKAIQEKCNIVKIVVMSGTNINKGNKIIRKESTEENTFFGHMNYTDMIEMAKGEMVVHRKFTDIQLVMSADEKKLNITQSFADADHHSNLADYVDQFVGKNCKLDLTDNEATMIFINTENNTHLDQFVEHYSDTRSSTIKTMLLTSKETSNNDAERHVNKVLKEMIKSNDTRKLVIFSRQMASRSFSIPEIDRVVIFKDGAISSADYQKMSRCLTWKEGKDSANIIRASFERIGLAEDMFLIENDNVENSSNDNLISKGHRFWQDFNTFNAFVLNEKGPTEKLTLDINELIDGLMEVTRQEGYINAKLWDADIEIDISIGKSTRQSKAITKSDSTKPESKISEGKKEDDKKKEVVLSDKQRLEYIKTMRIILEVLPVLCKKYFNIVSLDMIDTVSNESWKKHTRLDKEVFERNLENEAYKKVVDRIFQDAESQNEVVTLRKIQIFLGLED